jgi:hypothetical protein
MADLRIGDVDQYAAPVLVMSGDCDTIPPARSRLVAASIAVAQVTEIAPAGRLGTCPLALIFLSCVLPLSVASSTRRWLVPAGRLRFRWPDGPRTAT